MMLEFIAGHELPPRVVFKLELILEETLMNLIFHAYPEGGRHMIGLSIQLEPDAVVLSFEDDGKPFDPLQALAPVLPTTIDQARPGGLGLMLARKAASACQYERSGGLNRLTMQVARR